MAAVQPEPWLRALITTTNNNNYPNAFMIIIALSYILLQYGN
jgi:hypothetical protein